MAAEILHEPLDSGFIISTAVVVGLLLLFGAWDVPSGITALLLAGGVIAYLAQHKGLNLQWET